MNARHTSTGHTSTGHTSTGHTSTGHTSTGHTRTRCTATVAALAALALAAAMLAPRPAAAAEKNRWLAAGLNFFVPGAGYIYNGNKPLYVSVPMIAGAVGLTYVEQFHKFGDDKTLADHDSTAFGALFAAVFLFNTATAIDAWQEADAINNAAGKSAAFNWRIEPTAGAGGDRLGLSIRGSW